MPFGVTAAILFSPAPHPVFLSPPWRKRGSDLLPRQVAGDATRPLLPLPACRERVGVRGSLSELGLADSAPHPPPPPPPPPSPGGRGEGGGEGLFQRTQTRG